LSPQGGKPFILSLQVQQNTVQRPSSPVQFQKTGNAMEIGILDDHPAVVQSFGPPRLVVTFQQLRHLLEHRCQLGRLGY